MFDQSIQSPNQPEVEDIFAEADKPGNALPPPPRPQSRPIEPLRGPQLSPDPGMSPPASSVMPPPLNAPPEFETKNGIKPKPFIIGGVVLLILVLIGGGVWFFFFRKTAVPIDLNKDGVPAQVEVPNLQLDEPAPETAVEPEAMIETETEIETEPEAIRPIDTDGDGLTDEEEITLGTNVANPDSDSDLLFDKEERDVYGSDPLNSDTDGDGYADGSEVRNGYNPAGSGRLFEIPIQ